MEPLLSAEEWGFLFDVDGSGERRVRGGGADEEGVVAGSQGEGVTGGVEDGEVERVEGENDGLRFAGSEGDAIPCDEAPEGGFAGGSGQDGIDLGNFSSGAAAAVFHREGDFVLRGVEAGEFKGCVREAEAKGEKRG